MDEARRLKGRAGISGREERHRADVARVREAPLSVLDEGTFCENGCCYTRVEASPEMLERRTT